MEHEDNTENKDIDQHNKNSESKLIFVKEV